MNHLRLCLWAFSVLWKCGTIPRIARLRLWRKTLNLYICFLAFADNTRPRAQLQGAMTCALLSALYDYETDVAPVEDEARSLYFTHINRYVANPNAVHIGLELFKRERREQLSKNGLERGSIALEFYRKVIGSEWLELFSEGDISFFGRRLQMVDDAIDIEEDTQNGHKNCFLETNSEWHASELREFLRSKFFKTLEANSMVYHRMKAECLKLLREPKDSGPSIKELFRLARPHTGAFAFVLTCVGFKLIGPVGLPAVVTGFGFAGVTLSIMVWNDLMDRVRDTKKGKYIAFKHPYQVFMLWKWISVVTGIILIFSAPLLWKPVLLCLAVWGLGLLYSKTKLPYPFNNLLVAVCSGAPALAGILWSGEISWEPLLVFGIIVGTIAVTEMIKDIQDIEGDAWYKDTMALRVGRPAATLIIAGLSFFPIFFTLLYPHMAVRLTLFAFVLMLSCLGVSLVRPHIIYAAELSGDIFLTALLVVLLMV